MYENGIDVTYQLATGHDLRGPFGDPRTVVLPGWCAGDPSMAVTLHFFGHRSFESAVRVIDWQPSEQGACDDCGWAADECKCPFDLSLGIVDEESHEAPTLVVTTSFEAAVAILFGFVPASGE